MERLDRLRGAHLNRAPPASRRWLGAVALLLGLVVIVVVLALLLRAALRPDRPGTPPLTAALALVVSPNLEALVEET